MYVGKFGNKFQKKTDLIIFTRVSNYLLTEVPMTVLMDL